MSLLNNLKRYLYGTPGMEYGRENLGQMEGSQGLIGTGGESGGGLLQDSFSKMNNVEGGLLSNIPEGALLGAALYGQGLKGKDPLAGAFPAVTEAAKLKKLMTPKRTDLSKNLIEAGYKPGTPEYANALRSYLFKGKENTLGKEALSLYNESKTVDNFDNWYKELPTNKKQLWNKYIKGNEDLLTQMLMGNLTPDINTPDTADLSGLEITEDMITATIEANGGKISRQQAIEAIQKAYKKNPENFG